MRSLLLSFSLTLMGLSASAADHPNVVFLSVDDLKPVLGAYGNDEVPTPNIDRLAGRGTTMLSTYCQQAVCAPSRMSAFTGLRPDSTKVWDLRTHIQDANPAAVTMQQLFKEAGYVSAGAGKVMHGARNEHPESWSIPFTHHRKLPFAEGYPVPAHDNAFYQNERSHEVYNELEASGIRHWKERFDYLRERDAMPSTESLDVPDNAYVDGALAVWANQHLENFAQSGEPFFLTVGITKPHLPFVAPKKYWDLFDRDEIELAEFRQRAANSPDFAYHTFGELRSYSDIPSNFNDDIDEAKQRELIHGYYACVAFIDAQIGKILETLEATGLGGNTIVVLWGDHGYHLGDHGMWNKHSNFEQATHSPLIISAPGYKGGQKAAGMTEFVDIFPTLIELAGLDAPYELEGESLVPMLQDPSTQVKDYAISQYPRGGGRMGYALRTERYRLVMWMKFNWRSTMPYNPGALEAVELYDYEKDPLETVNVADDPAYADVVADLKAKMGEFFATYEDVPEAAEAEVLESLEPGQSGAVVNLTTLDLTTIETRFASVEKVNGELIVDFEHSPKWPSIDIFAPADKAWDLTGYGSVDVKLTNHSTQDIKTVAYITNQGDSNLTQKRNGTQVEIPAGSTDTIRINFDPQQYPLDLSQLHSIRIFVNKLQGPAKFTVHSITANTSPVAMGAAQIAPPKSSGGLVQPGAKGDLLHLEDPASLTTDLRFARVSPSDQGLILDFDLSPKWPSVEFFGDKKATWDLSSYAAIEIELTNLGEKPENLFAYAANPFEDYRNKQTSGSGKVAIAPGGTATVRIPLQGVDSFNPSNVEAVRIYTGKHTAPVKVRLESIRVVQ